MRRNLRFIWDDARVDADFTGNDDEVLEAAVDMSIRARMALAIGLYEWVVWRFDGLHAHAEPTQVLQAAWCATVDPRYLRYFELDRNEWIGPVDGALWCAMTHLRQGLAHGYAYEGDLFDTLRFLHDLAAHVLPLQEGFRNWLKPVLDRLVDNHPPHNPDPLADLFNQRIGEQLGPLVGRDELDPNLPPNPQRTRAFLQQTLAGAIAEANPFLATPADLADLGFDSEPYALPDATTLAAQWLRPPPASS
ncbi:hypothetical protein [Pseudomonas sp. RW409]|uniref:hypothetical protein n=1 Tax=Pseudomonas sp. RW409 TaxID=2202895 RepID=UPI000D72BF81|nr:hypothetical protein [Pseudomonas sp. RW409]PWY36408.1 hypothetical protein DK261_28295 [Pseudomonas sp. RW409]